MSLLCRKRFPISSLVLVFSHHQPCMQPFLHNIIYIHPLILLLGGEEWFSNDWIAIKIRLRIRAIKSRATTTTCFGGILRIVCAAHKDIVVSHSSRTDAMLRAAMVGWGISCTWTGAAAAVILNGTNKNCVARELRHRQWRSREKWRRLSGIYQASFRPRPGSSIVGFTVGFSFSTTRSVCEMVVAVKTRALDNTYISGGRSFYRPTLNWISSYRCGWLSSFCRFTAVR